MPGGARSPVARAILIGATVAVVVGVLVVVVLRDDGDGPLPATGSLVVALRGARAAASAWPGWTETDLAVGSECLRVLVADTPAERVRGLRNVEDLAPYDGTLFVSPEDDTAAFTMAGVPDDLDITWYDRNGAPVDSTTMRACPGTDATCPTYESADPFRYALERPGGEGGPGALAACS